MKHDVDLKLARMAAAGGGALDRTEAIAATSASSVLSRQRSGVLIPVHSRSFVHRDFCDPLSEIRALCLAFPTGGAARKTALSLAGLPVDDQPQQFVVPHGHRPNKAKFIRLKDLLVHETRHLPAEHLAQYQDIRCTSAARAIADLAPQEWLPWLVHLTEHALTSGVTSSEEMIACLSERHRRGIPRIQDLRLLLVDALHDQPCPQNLFELDVLRSIENEGIDGLIPQFVPPWYDGVRGITDIGDKLGRTIVEADGRSFRQVTAAHDNDRRRTRLAARHGFPTIRVGHREFYQGRARVAIECAEIIRQRRAAARLSAA